MTAFFCYPRAMAKIPFILVDGSSYLFRAFHAPGRR